MLWLHRGFDASLLHVWLLDPNANSCTEQLFPRCVGKGDCQALTSSAVRACARLLHPSFVPSRLSGTLACGTPCRGSVRLASFSFLTAAWGYAQALFAHLFIWTTDFVRHAFNARMPGTVYAAVCVPCCEDRCFTSSAGVPVAFCGNIMGRHS